MGLNTIFFIGPQGSGKGTQAKILAERLNFFYPAPFDKDKTPQSQKNQTYPTMTEALKSGKWSGVYWEMGGILREVAKEETELGRKVKEMVDNGILLPDDFLLQVVESRLSKISADTGVIFDGIPRRLGQAEFLINFLKNQGRKNFTTLFIDLPKEESITRLLLRAQKEGRLDDTREKIEVRLQQYYNDTLPVLDFLKTQSVFFEIDGQPSIEEVTKDINKALEL
jgi:adenylate kinase